MHRFYLPPEQCAESVCVLRGGEAHHAIHVLRVRPRDRFSILDGAGRELQCEAVTVGKDELRAQVLERRFTPPPSTRITLLQAIPKGKIIESILQKSTELGVARIIPLASERVTSRLSLPQAREKAEKWREVAVEAIKQSGATWLPTVEIPVSPEDFLQREERFDLSLIGSLQPDREPIGKWFDRYRDDQGKTPASVAVWIGPEGDFTIAEIMAARASGALPFTLGSLVLRVETAAIAALAIVNHELQAERGRRN